MLHLAPYQTPVLGRCEQMYVRNVQSGGGSGRGGLVSIMAPVSVPPAPPTILLLIAHRRVCV